MSYDWTDVNRKNVLLAHFATFSVGLMLLQPAIKSVQMCYNIGGHYILLQTIFWYRGCIPKKVLPGQLFICNNAFSRLHSWEKYLLYSVRFIRKQRDKRLVGLTHIFCKLTWIVAYCSIFLKQNRWLQKHFCTHFIQRRPIKMRIVESPPSLDLEESYLSKRSLFFSENNFLFYHMKL